MENELQKINKFISIDRIERGTCALYYDMIRDYIFSKMKAVDPVFNQLVKGHTLAGSCKDGLKITKPNEFDLVIHMKLPHSYLISVEKDNNRPGNVKINIKDMLQKLVTETHNSSLYTQLVKLCNDEKYLLQNEWQSWMESIMTKTVKSGLKFTIEGIEFLTKFTKSGPALTFDVNVNGKYFSIDFVPSLFFNKTKWTALRSYPTDVKAITDWLAIPKPIKGLTGNNISWQGSYTATEEVFIGGKNNLKNTLKMIKKIRDRNGLENLKSYFIKTVYLWETTQTNTLWNQSAEIVLIHMLGKVVQCLENRSIPFFWDEKCNMLGNLKDNQIFTMHGQMKKRYDDLQKYRREKLITPIANVFLTPEELREYNNPQIVEEITTVIENPTEKKRTCVIC